jgi:hypothetical protein
MLCVVGGGERCCLPSVGSVLRCLGVCLSLFLRFGTLFAEVLHSKQVPHVPGILPFHQSLYSPTNFDNVIFLDPRVDPRSPFFNTSLLTASLPPASLTSQKSHLSTEMQLPLWHAVDGLVSALQEFKEFEIREPERARNRCEEVRQLSFALSLTLTDVLSISS